MLECLSAATLVVLIAYRPMAGLFDPLDFQVCRFYGRVSYSFYLLHTLGILFGGRALPLFDFSLFALSFFPPTLFFTLVFSRITTPAPYFSWPFCWIPRINL